MSEAWVGRDGFVVALRSDGLGWIRKVAGLRLCGVSGPMRVNCRSSRGHLLERRLSRLSPVDDLGFHAYTIIHYAHSRHPTQHTFRRRRHQDQR